MQATSRPWRVRGSVQQICPRTLGLQRAQYRGPEDHINTRISHSGSKAQYKGASRK